MSSTAFVIHKLIHGCLHFDAPVVPHTWHHKSYMTSIAHLITF